MAVVETVRGPVDLSSLGQTLMHEHVYGIKRYQGLPRNPPLTAQPSPVSIQLHYVTNRREATGQAEEALRSRGA